MQNTLISVIIPCFNHAQYLPDALDSVLAQTYRYWECIIVNDGSTDDSLSIIEKYASLDSRFKYISIPNSGCAYLPRQKGISISNSDWISFLDADDYFSFDYLEKLIDKANQASTDIVLGRMIFLDNKTGKELWTVPSKYFNIEQELTGLKACSLTIGGWEIATCGLIKRHLVNNIFDTDLIFYDEYNSRITLLNAHKVKFSNAEYFYRIHPNSITHKVSVKLFDIIPTDYLLEKLVNTNYSELSGIPRKMRKARLLNLINYHVFYYEIRRKLNKEEKKTVALLIKENFKNQNFRELKKELPYHWRIAFLTSYPLFILCSNIYSKIKPSKFLI